MGFQTHGRADLTAAQVKVDSGCHHDASEAFTGGITIRRFA